MKSVGQQVRALTVEMVLEAWANGNSVCGAITCVPSCGSCPLDKGNQWSEELDYSCAAASEMYKKLFPFGTSSDINKWK